MWRLRCYECPPRIFNPRRDSTDHYKEYDKALSCASWSTPGLYSTSSSIHAGWKQRPATSCCWRLGSLAHSTVHYLNPRKLKTEYICNYVEVLSFPAIKNTYTSWIMINRPTRSNGTTQLIATSSSSTIVRDSVLIKLNLNVHCHHFGELFFEISAVLSNQVTACAPRSVGDALT